jgi:hypothetical protein
MDQSLPKVEIDRNRFWDRLLEQSINDIIPHVHWTNRIVQWTNRIVQWTIWVYRLYDDP